MNPLDLELSRNALDSYVHGYFERFKTLETLIWLRTVGPIIVWRVLDLLKSSCESWYLLL
jgi:hypothetical protein